MYNNNRGQGAAFVGLIMLVIALMIFFIAIPFINEFIDYGASTTGNATGFVIRSIPWVVLILLVIFGIKLVIYGGGT